MFFNSHNNPSSANAQDDVSIKSYAYDALIDYNIKSLPVFVDSLLLEHNIHIFPMQCFLAESIPINCDITLYDSVLMCIDNMQGKRYVIMYDDTKSDSVVRWSVSKALYYIGTGYADNYKNKYINCDALPDSDIFAFHFSCPDVILDGCKIVNAKDIIQYCGIPFWQAAKKSLYLKSKRKAYPFPAIEKIVKKNFKQFIDTLCLKHTK